MPKGAAVSEAGKISIRDSATGLHESVGDDNPMPVKTNTELPAIVFSLDTNAYATGDVLAATQALASAFRSADGTGILQSIVLVDKDDQGAALDLVILKADVSIGTENAAVSISDANADSVLGIISVSAGDWIDLGGCRVATLRGLGLVVKAATGTTSLYVALISRGSPTHSAAGITAQFGILQD